MHHMHIFDQTCSCFSARKLHGRFLLVVLSALGLVLPARAANPCFARFSTDRAILCQGESFQLTLSIYSTGETLDKEISIANMPSTADLQLRGFNELPIESVALDGQSYAVRKFRSWARAPKVGTLTLFPRLDGTLIQVSRAFFFMSETRHPVHIPVEPLVIPVRPLPGGAPPATFSGLVGVFSFKVKAAPLDIALGDLITVTYTIEGDWLPDDFPKPQIRPEAGLKVYESKLIADECSPTKQVCRQTVVPESLACKAIPSMSLVYFDTSERRFKMLTCGPFPITYHQERMVVHPIYAPPTQDVRAITSAPTMGPSTVLVPDNTWWQNTWNRLCGVKEIVIAGTGEIPVRFAPSDSSRQLFTVKPGATVRMESTNEDWIRISCPQGTGWVPKSETL